MASLVGEIRVTRSAAWYATRSAATDAHGHQVWTTRVQCYERLLDVLSQRPGDGRHGRVERKDLTGTVSVATLYNRFGNDAADSLRPRAAEGYDLAARAQGTDRRWDMVDNLAVEAKLWSFWPYRAGWLDDLVATAGEDRRTIAEKLVRVVAVWAFANQRIAAYLKDLPPLAAVEDLCVIMPGPVSAEQVMPFLSEVIRAALGPLGGEPASVLNTVHEELMELGFHRSSYVDELLARTVDAVEEVGYLLPRLDDRDRGRASATLRPRVAELMRRIDKEEDEEGPDA